jgi:hypothetical protein
MMVLKLEQNMVKNFIIKHTDTTADFRFYSTVNNFKNFIFIIHFNFYI